MKKKLFFIFFICFIPAFFFTVNVSTQPLPWLQLLLLSGEDVGPPDPGSFIIPDTGLIICYDADGEIIHPCPSEGDDFYGQDACYTINPPSYTKLDSNGNELGDSAADWAMVKDDITGLIWERKTNDDSIHDKDNIYIFSNASDVFIAALNSNSFGGYSDWRMPTVNELHSITHLGIIHPAINTDYFPDTMSSNYWSSTARASDTLFAWNVEFNFGSDTYSYKTTHSYHVRAVRSGQ